MNQSDLLINQNQHVSATQSQSEQQYTTTTQYNHECPVVGQGVEGNMSKTALFPEWSTATPYEVDVSQHQEVYSDDLGVAQDVFDAALQYDHHKRAMVISDGQPEPKRPRTHDAFYSSGANKKVHNEQWDAMFERLREYKDRYGNCLVPKRFTEDPKLGTWVETQRVQYKRLARTQDESGQEIIHPNKRLTTERLQKLESIGFAWVAKYVKKSSPKRNPSETLSIGETTMMQQERQQQRRQRLNEALWEEMYQRLVHYKEQFGDCLVPRKFEGDPKLATWVETQRVLWNKEIKQGGTSTPPPAQPETMDMEDAKSKRLTAERKQKLDALGFVWSLRSKRIDDHWDEMFRQLVDYKKVHGDCLVPSRFESNLKLGKWVETQRYEYTKLQRKASSVESVASNRSEDGSADESKPRATNPRLTEDRLKRLEDIGFEWKVKNKMKRYYDKQWDQMFQRLLQFKKVNGHCLVPKRYLPDMKLGTWVHTQRIQYRKLLSNKKDGEDDDMSGSQNSNWMDEENAAMNAGEEGSFRLTEGRRKRLEEVGFAWSAREVEKGTEVARVTRNTYDDQWDIMFDKLKEYKEVHGDCLVPKRYKENPKLGTWVDTQRVQFKKLQKILASKGKNTEPTIEAPPAEFAEAAAKPLVGRLTEDRIQRLQSIGFVWSLRDDWQKHYEELKAYKAEFGHCNVPARYEKNRRLGIWVSAQRQQYKIMRQMPESAKARRSAPLTEERIGLLNDIGFTWTIRSRDTFGESWNQRFEELKEFKRIHGHCLVPSRYSESPELGVWVGTQRTQYRLYMSGQENGTSTTSSMNEDRIRALEELGFAWGLRGGRGGNQLPMEEAIADAEAGASNAGIAVSQNQYSGEEGEQRIDQYVAHQI
eukprot:scaffold1442_cov128-Cylindrotheca_fusiformis.AAC.31